jgi:membrane protein DedA with SNARE-associated domain
MGGMGAPFFPEDATFILCGFLIHSGIVKLVPALIVVYTGVLIADFIIYVFGRKYGRMAICHRWFRRFLSSEKLSILEEKFKKRGIYFILIGRHFVGVRVQVILVSGIMRMPALRFLITDALTSLFTIALWTAVGYWGGRGLKELGIDIIKKISLWKALSVSPASHLVFLLGLFFISLPF